MPFRPLDALVELDRRLTPGSIGRLYIAHYKNVRQRAASLSTDTLIAEIARYQKAEPARLLISVGMVAEFVLIPEVFAREFPVETVLGVLVATPFVVLFGLHRGTVKLHDREIMEEELNQRREPDAIG